MKPRHALLLGLALFLMPLLVMGAALSPSNFNSTQFTNSGPVNGQPLISLTSGANATNVTIINLTTTNAFITYVTNVTAYVTNLFAVTEYVTNLNVTYLTNQTFYTTNVFATTINASTNFVTENFSTNLFSTNIFTTNLFATFITNNTSFITNLFATNIITTNLFSTTVNATTNFVTENFSTNLFSTNIITTNLFATYITNDTSIITNLFVTNAFISFITNQTLFTTNIFATTVNSTTNISNFNFSTNLVTSNAFFTNIFVMQASWFTNKWVGPTNDVNFNSTYQNFIAAGDMEVTGFQNSIATNANTSVLLIDPGGATRHLYFPDNFTNYTSDGNNAYVIPSTNTAIVTMLQYGNLYTNIVVRLFGPGNSFSNSVFSVLPSDIAYTDKNNAFTTASSNYFAGAVTTSTNQNQITPDFSVEEQLISTNAAFTFLAPVGVDSTKTTVQWHLCNVTNTTSAAVLITSPANCHTVGTAYVTNWTAVWFQCYAQKITNAYYVPVF